MIVRIQVSVRRDSRSQESAWSYGRPAYRCRHGYTSATVPDTGRPKNAYVREDQILPHLAGSDGSAALIDQLRACGTVLTYDPAGQTLRAGGHDAPSVTVGRNH